MESSDDEDYVYQFGWRRQSSSSEEDDDEEEEKGTGSSPQKKRDLATVDDFGDEDQGSYLLATLAAVSLDLDLISGEDMDVRKCIVTSRLGGTVNSRRAASPLVRSVEGKERWEAPDPQAHELFFSHSNSLWAEKQTEGETIYAVVVVSFPKGRNGSCLNLTQVIFLHDRWRHHLFLPPQLRHETEGERSLAPCIRGFCCAPHKTFGPSDLTSTYSVCTRRVFGSIGHRTQALRSGVLCSNH
ncbi:hypothetical protein TNCV_659561 [Trichonephila clavipes]|nr:hypothetical protein TNCV_659561 [Trichonephila clavipes]